MTSRAVTFTLYGRGDSALYPPLPLLVVDAERKEVRRLSLSTAVPCHATFEVGDMELFAMLQLPSGRNLVKPLEVGGVWQDVVAFEVGTESPHEWMAWSAMRVDLRRGVAPLMDEPGMEGAWLQLWELDADRRRWMQMAMPGEQIEHEREGTQVELNSSTRPRALLAYLGTGSPQLIALPARQRVMVLLTRAHALPTSDAPRVLVGGYGGAAEGVLEFMRKGSLGSASAALDPGSDLANQLLYSKIDDPLAATAAAYYLLRKRDWERLPQQWLQNLAAWFNDIPDATLLRDASLIQRGMDAKAAPALAATSLKAAFAQGLPLFAEARSVMEDLLLYAERASSADGLTRAQRDMIRGMLAAFQPAGLSFGFFGTAPDRPTARHEARRATRTLELERRLRDIGSEVLDIGALIVLMSGGTSSNVSRGLEVAVKEVSAAIRAFGAGQPAVPGDVMQTLFVKDIYDPKGRTAGAPQLVG